MDRCKKLRPVLGLWKVRLREVQGRDSGLPQGEIRSVESSKKLYSEIGVSERDHRENDGLFCWGNGVRLIGQQILYLIGVREI